MLLSDYSSNQLPSSQQFEYWMEIVCRHCLLADCNPSTKTSFAGELHGRAVGTLEVFNLRAPNHHWSRLPKHMKINESDDIWLCFTNKAVGGVAQGGRSTKLSLGSMAIYDSNQPFELELGGDEFIVISLPRTSLVTEFPNIANMTALKLDTKRPGVIPLRELVLQAASYSQIDRNDKMLGRMSEAIIDLLVLSLGGQDFVETHDEKDLFPRALKFITENLGDCDLNAQKIADAHHVSVRTLTRAFARHGMSPISVLWDQRLISCFKTIQQGTEGGISRIALDNGFTNLSHFSHAFKRKFGRPPNKLSGA